MTQAPLELADIKYADVVVVGRISNYAIVRDPTIRQELANSPDISPQRRESLENESFLGDYARFDVLVDEVLVGKAPQTLVVTWDNSTFAEPKAMPSGPFLIALRDPRFGTLPLRGPSATILPNPEPASMTVLQAPCSDPFIFASDSEKARAILQILHR
ncbi:MAG TPA: hypothetical protein VJV39_17980 [Dongiaceae bacterium]|nr:hypothetical protein [Dongiaceae bacterium]